jgi:hypothetical protein
MSQCKLENVQELCVGDLISFEERVYVTRRSEYGGQWFREDAGIRCLEAQVLKPSKKGNVSIKVTKWPGGDHDYQHGTILTRRPEKIIGFRGCRLNPREDGTRGKLLYATAKSMHPDAVAHVMAPTFVADEQFSSRKTFSIYSDEIARRCWDSECQIREQEALADKE